MAENEDQEERDFHHPFHPYEVQKQLMNALYECIEAGKVGIFESPTGTGKSLSIICASLTWLRDYKRKSLEEGIAAEVGDEDEPEWILEHARQEKKQAMLRQRAELEKRLALIRAKEKRAKERFERGEPRYKRQKTDTHQQDEDNTDEARFILDDYESDNDVQEKSKAIIATDSGLFAETQALMDKLGYPVDLTLTQKEDEYDDEMKIFYCSRTHSQLTQFANELKRVKLPPAMSANHLGDSLNGQNVETLEEGLKHLTLGSRKNLCINAKVRKLQSATAINERCLELQQPGTSAQCKCQYLPTKETEAVVNDFRDHAIAKIRDIEDLGVLGKELGICPYYASRQAIKPCEIVTLPYPLILQKSAREALAISLKGHVVIIDEAHNLMDAIAGIHSISVTLSQLQRSREQLGIYLQKFRNKLKGKNRVYVTQIVRLLDSLIGYLQTKNEGWREAEGLVQIGDLMAGKGVDQINLFKLSHYLYESKLARKVDGYIIHIDKERKTSSSNSGTIQNTLSRSKGSVPVLTHIQGFLLALMNPSAEGRFFFSKEQEPGGISLKYMLLDPTFHFKDIVQEARAVILVGGTMSPMSDYEQHLLSYLDPSRIMTLSCGHVIPPTNLLAWPVVQGPSGAAFDFTFEKRNSEKMILDLGITVLNFAQHVPSGMVVFFPSYAYLDTCVAAWKRLHSRNTSSGIHSVSLWNEIQGIKPIFLEQRSNSQPSTSASSISYKKPTPAPLSTTDSVLAAYSQTIATKTTTGAILLAVIGGTLSEGINFSDALCRAVLIVGLPFPNPHSAEWKTKMQYISSKAGPEGGKGGKAAAQDFYENACMRAVNQCVGRAIRHHGDYAAILMLDRRYGGRIQTKLPGWIRSSMRPGAGFEEVKRGLDGFFEGKK